MQQSVQNVEAQLAFHAGVKGARLPCRCLGADHDFAVLKREHIGRAGDAAELLV